MPFEVPRPPPMRTKIYGSAILALAIHALACASPDALPNAELVAMSRFPHQAHLVLQSEGAFVSRGDGFVTLPYPTRGIAQRLGEPIDTVLPPHGGAPLIFQAPKSGFLMKLYEVGSSGEARREGQALWYARPDGRSYWNAIPQGVEEWLLIDGAYVERDRPVAQWEIEGATFRQSGALVEVLDERGRPRIQVSAPEGYGEGGRRIDLRLSASGSKLELYADAEGETVLLDPRWVLLGAQMNEGRSHHTATVLLDGRVLVTGGRDSQGGFLSSAEVYDPETESFALLAQPMSAGRSEHTATLLPSGKVLIAGGDGSGIQTAELFDPGINGFEPPLWMNDGHAVHTATPLQDGSVLIAGGFTNGAELYHPVQNNWEPLPPLSDVYTYHRATVMNDGRVLLTGGYGPNFNESTHTEIYDPASKDSTPAPPLNTARLAHSSVRLSDGKILVAGGLKSGFGGYEYSVEVFDPDLGVWLPRTPIPTAAPSAFPFGQADGGVLFALINGSAVYDPKLDQWTEGLDGLSFHIWGAAVELLNGQILNIGGQDEFTNASALIERYDPSQGAWVKQDSLSANKGSHTATLLQNGTVLFTGGGTGNGPLNSWASQSSVDLFQPATETNSIMAPIQTARHAHTATLLNTGEVLIAGGYSTVSPFLSTIENSVELFDPNTPSWQALPRMKSGRAEHSATLLSNGDVLVAGGEIVTPQPWETKLKEAELFHADTQQWTPVAPMHHARSAHAATPLLNGKILVTGGFGETAVLMASEIFDPATQQWTEINPMLNPRGAHQATRLPDGRVLVTGGYDGLADSNKAEIFNPGTGQWQQVGTMNVSRSRHLSTLLPDGRVMVAGDAIYVEFFNPNTLSFEVDSEAIILLSHMAGTLLSSGQFLASGGVSDTLFNNGIYLYDPASRWVNGQPTNEARADAGVALLEGGDILVTGGQGRFGPLATVEQTNAPESPFQKTGSMIQSRFAHLALPLPGGDALAIGGIGPTGYLAQSERYNAATGQWMSTGNLNQARAYASGTRLLDGKLFVAGGFGPGGLLASAEVYDPALDAWEVVPSMADPRRNATTTLLGNGLLLVAGGWGGQEALNTAELYIPQQKAWLNAGSFGNSRVGHTATLLSNGHVLLAGGTDTASAVIFDPATFQWTPTGPMHEVRSGHIAARLPSGQVVVAGGLGPNGLTKSAELYDPAANTWKAIRKLTLPRRNAWAFAFGDGSVMIGGGAGVSDEPIAFTEIFRLSQNGELCIHAADCESGFCADNVCCNTACDGGPCDGCSVLTGSKQAGFCTQFNGLSCDDGVKCTENDACQLGQCKGTSKACEAPDDCHENPSCDEATGQCAEAKPKANGTPCNEGDACAISSLCSAGICKITPKECPAPTACHEEGFCNSSTGDCFNPLKNDGSVCEDGANCTENDRCEAGVCIGSPVLCPAIGVCYEPGICEKSTGQCPTPVPRENGALCDDENPCTEGDACGDGTCVGKEMLCDCQGCGAYRCFGSPTHCLDACSSVLECALGYVCNRQGQCVPPPPSGSVLDAGCSYGGRGNSSSQAYWLSLLLAMALFRPRKSSSFSGIFSVLFLMSSGCQWVAEVDREGAKSNSQTPTCGNGAADPAERCDDGNRTEGDGCSPACAVEMGFECGKDFPSLCKAICGDGLIAGVESCDDGNVDEGDGCSGACALEIGFVCTASPSQCDSVCGDGIVAGLEGCDDKNTLGNDGCSSHCEREIGWTCNDAHPSVCKPICGNGVVDGKEQCDDGNTDKGDGCSGFCSIEPGWRCTNIVSPTYCEDADECALGIDSCDPHTSVCINEIGTHSCACLAGYKKGRKGCKDIDECALGTHSCDINALCINTPGSYVCACKTGTVGNGKFCSPLCGDGIVVAGESCDDGNFQPGDGCSGGCAIESGYACAGTPSVCADIDECAQGTDGCDINAQCVNLVGSYQCVCNPGYTGNGLICSDLNECDLYPAPCSPFADCQNTSGGFLCTCLPGFEGDGITCTDIDECALGIDDCIHSPCFNNIGGYACGQCDAGYSGYGKDCIPGCGDGLIVFPEWCDDGNLALGDGCDANCVLELNASCVGEPSQCSICGDGVPGGGELCDDGNLSDCDSCGINCRPMNIFSTGPNLSMPIPDGAFDGTPASMTCAGIPVPPLSGSGLVQRLCVETGITHPNHNDIAIFLLNSVADVPLYYSFQPGAAGAGLLASYPIRFELNAPFPWFFMGSGLSGNQIICQDDGMCTFSPAQFFGPFGLPSPTEGNWQLCVGDRSSGGAGTLESWKIFIQD